MKNLIFAGSLLFLSGNLYAQDVPIKVFFEKDGKETTISKLSVQWVLDGDTIVTEAHTDTLKIPKALFGRKGQGVFSINNEKYEFSNMVVAWNDELYQWNFVVDTKPFDKEKFWSVTNWKKIKVIYSLDYGNGKQITQYRYKKKYRH